MRTPITVLGCAFLALLAGIPGATNAETELPPGAEISETIEEWVDPEFEWEPNRTTDAMRERIRTRFEELKERVQSQTPASLEGPPVAELELPSAGPTRAAQLSESEFHGTPSAMYRINRRNTAANSASTLAEPVAAASGKHRLAGGNTHFEYSTNGGATWTDIPIPAGPSYAPNDCCDPDVQFVQGRGVTFYLALYLNSNATRGAVRIFVRRKMTGPTSCSYTFNYGLGVVPDYPHLGQSNDFLYLSTNNVGAGGWSGSQMKRINLDQMADCVTASLRTFTYTGSVGQRVFVPAEGATEEMYWVTNENTTQSRVFRWGESNILVQSYLVNRSASVFSNPNCRGGVNNYDWIEKSTAWNILGFRVRSAIRKCRYLCAYWNVGPDGSHPQGHVHAACFDVGPIVPTLVAQPHIWNSSRCFGFPAVSTNSRGDLGLSIGFGGDDDPFSGTAARGYIGIDDDFTPGMGFFQTVYLTATGDRNRSDGRHGDYYTVRQASPCGESFVATNYGLFSTSRNVRVVTFARQRDSRCILEWWLQPRPTVD